MSRCVKEAIELLFERVTWIKLFKKRSIIFFVQRVLHNANINQEVLKNKLGFSFPEID